MVEEITAKQADEKIRLGEAYLVDVREPDEYAQEHIVKAVSIPLSQLPDKLALLKEDVRPIIFQCLSGKRSEQACQFAQLEALRGYEIYTLIGGIKAWKQAGLPTIAKQKGLPIMRQVQIVVGSAVLLSTLAGLSGVNAAFYIAAFFGAGLLFAGVSGWCGMARLLKRMPWNA